MLVHIVMIASHSCCRFVVCTSMMWISRSTTSQRCSIGLRSGDCGGHLTLWIHAFMFFTPNSDPTSECSRNQDSSEQATFFNLLLSSFGESVWIVSSVSCSYLTGAAPGVVFCCWSTSASGFDVLCVQRWCSVDLGCNEWLFELLLSFYHL